MYTQPGKSSNWDIPRSTVANISKEDIHDIYKAMSAVSPYFSIAAGFGNVHGVYASPVLRQPHSNIC
jgi:fructose/tagatose bisphosphate aldolase